MLKRFRLLLLIVLISVWTGKAFGQACSCGGAPLVGTLNSASLGNGDWQIGLTYDYSSISDVVSGSSILPDNNRHRNVQSGMLEINYGISDRFSISTLFAILGQKRVSGSSEGTGEQLNTRGFADGLFLLKYDLIPFNGRYQRQIAIGGGVKLPLGKSGLTFDNSLIAADMQPGTGSWDAVFSGQIYQGLYGFLPLGIFSDISYRLTGSNDRFGLNDLGYRFGNEFNWSFDLNGEILPRLNYLLGFNYRTVAPSQFGGAELPNSGGRWLDLKPGINITASDAISFRLLGYIPIGRKLEGTQLTTSYRLAISFIYAIKPGNSKSYF